MKKYSSMLIIECDSNKLNSQRINIAKEIDVLFRNIPICGYDFIQVYSKSDLCTKLSEITGKQYDIVVIVGHTISNASDMLVVLD